MDTPLDLDAVPRASPQIPGVPTTPLGDEDVSPIPSPRQSSTKTSGKRRGFLRRMISLIPGSKTPGPVPASTASQESLVPRISSVPSEELGWKKEGNYVRSNTAIGSGAYGFVYRGRCLLSPARQLVAVKVYIVPNPPNDTSFFHYENETKALSTLQANGNGHQNIITILDLYRFENNPRIVLEYCETSLLDVLQNDELKPRFDEDHSREVLRHVLSGLQYSQGLGVYNCDLKLENILFVRNPVNALDNSLRPENLSSVRIIDWGFAIVDQLPRGYTRSLHKYNAGSDHYSAPEVGQNFAIDPALADMWSFGVCLYACLTKRLPWAVHSSDPEKKAQAKLDKQNGHYSPLTNVSPHVVGLINGLFQPDPTDRFNCDRAARHEWFSLTPRKYMAPIGIPPLRRSSVKERP